MPLLPGDFSGQVILLQGLQVKSWDGLHLARNCQLISGLVQGKVYRKAGFEVPAPQSIDTKPMAITGELVNKPLSHGDVPHIDHQLNQKPSFPM